MYYITIYIQLYTYIIEMVGVHLRRDSIAPTNAESAIDTCTKVQRFQGFNPSEKYAGQIRSSPQVEVNIKENMCETTT